MTAPETFPEQRIWVLEDTDGEGAEPAIGIAERLNLPFRRVPLSWNWLAPVAALAPHGSLLGLTPLGRGAGLPMLMPWHVPFVVAAPPMGPELILSAGPRAASVALWLKRRFGSRLVHCMRPGLRRAPFDLLVIPEHEWRPAGPPAGPHVLRVLAAPNRVSRLALRHAAGTWTERLAHLPHPRVALLVGGRVGGTDMPPSMAYDLGRHVARLAAAHGGAVMASTSRRTGQEATDALAAGLSPCLNLLYRWGEPGDNPYLGFLALADAIVVTADSAAMLGEACATSAPVHVALPELATPRQKRLIDGLSRAGHARPLGDSLTAWPRRELDEAARVAAEIGRLFPLD